MRAKPVNTPRVRNDVSSSEGRHLSVDGRVGHGRNGAVNVNPADPAADAVEAIEALPKSARSRRWDWPQCPAASLRRVGPASEAAHEPGAAPWPPEAWLHWTPARRAARSSEP